MIRHKYNKLHILNKLLDFYPEEYRSYYQDEMLYVASAMLQEAATKREQFIIVNRLIRDYLISVISQNIDNFKRRLYKRPKYLRQSSVTAVILLVPYFSAAMYRFIAQNILHRVTLISQLEARTWFIYCIILPSIALVLVSTAATFRIHNATKGYAHNAEGLNGSGFTQDALILGLPISLLTAVALL